MKNFLYSSTISLCLILILDVMWFSVAVEKLYKPYLGHIISGNFNYFVAAIFYTLYCFGISYLILIPGLEHRYAASKILSQGFVLGFIAYAAYDLTNQATIKDWPIIVTVIDMLWGAVLTASVSLITYKIMLIFKK